MWNVFNIFCQLIQPITQDCSIVEIKIIVSEIYVDFILGNNIVRI